MIWIGITGFCYPEENKQLIRVHGERAQIRETGQGGRAMDEGKEVI
jgi:hypothetical protein